MNKVEEIGIKVYVYALIDEDGNMCYIGKSSQPKQRMFLHRNQGFPTVNKVKILDIFYDTENYWIYRSIEEGHKLQNKEISQAIENHNIGDIITTSDKVSTRVLNTSTGEVYESMYKASELLEIPYDTVRLLINIKPTSRIKTKELFKIYPLVAI